MVKITLFEEFTKAETELTEKRILDKHYLRKRPNLNYNEVFLFRQELSKSTSRNVTKKTKKNIRKNVLSSSNPKNVQKQNSTKHTSGESTYKKECKFLKRNKISMKNYNLRKNIKLIYPIVKKPKDIFKTIIINPEIQLKISGKKPNISFYQSKSKNVLNIEKTKKIEVSIAKENSSKNKKYIEKSSQTDISHNSDNSVSNLKDEEKYKSDYSTYNNNNDETKLFNDNLSMLSCMKPNNIAQQEAIDSYLFEYMKFFNNSISPNFALSKKFTNDHNSYQNQETLDDSFEGSDESDINIEDEQIIYESEEY